jgi:hypothetical protein
LRGLFEGRLNGGFVMGKTKSVIGPARAMKLKSARLAAKPAALTTEQRARLEAFDRYIAKCMDDDSGEQEETWTVLKKALDDNRTSTRKHFRD